MTIVARLTALLTANTTSFESNLKRANTAMGKASQSWNSDLGKASRSFSNFDTHVRRSIGSIGDLKTQVGGIASAVAGALSVQKIIQYSDTWKQLEGRLKIVEGSMSKVVVAQEELFNIAQRTKQPLESVTTLYTKLNTALGDNRKKLYDVAGITETVALALAVTGEGAAQSSSAILQFSQAVSSDFKASAQEINSLLDSAPRLALALQQGLGDGTKSLKQMAEDGELSTERVLRVLEPLANQGKEIRQEFSQMQTTVSQALTQLDNAFLRFIGQTDMVKNGTTSLAGAITLLANNFDLLARAALGVALVMGARLAQSVTAAALSFTVATARATVFNYQLGVLAFGSRAASVAMVGLAGATSLLGGAIAFLGGPVGVALIGTMALMARATNAARDAQAGLNAAVSGHRQAALEFISASSERRQAIERDTKANIENYKRELIAIEKIAQALDSENALFKFSRNIGSKLGIDTSAEDVRKVATEVRKVIADLESDLASFGQNSGGGSTGGGIDKKAANKLEDIVRDLKEESEQLSLQTSLYGQKESAIEAASRALKVQQQIEAAGIKLTQSQREEIDKYLESIERQTVLQEEQTKQQERLEERERNRRQAIDQLGSSFESAFEKAIVEGEKLGDVLDSLGQDIVKLLTRMVITEPLVSGLSDMFRTDSGGGGSFLSNLFGLQSFASGIDYVPNDTYAKIHKGEAVVRAQELRNMGGGDVNVVIQNNNGSSVSTSTRDTENGPELTVMIDQAVADNISRRGSRTNQALQAQMNRSVVRRG